MTVKRPRFDISEVAPQGEYVARRCPVRAQYDELRPAEPLPPSPAALRRRAADLAFEADVFARLVDLVPATVVIEPGGPEDRTDRERRTLAAMSNGRRSSWAVDSLPMTQPVASASRMC